MFRPGSCAASGAMAVTSDTTEVVTPPAASIWRSAASSVRADRPPQASTGMMGMLKSIGIEKGKDFKPDAATQNILKSAAQEAQAKHGLHPTPRASKRGSRDHVAGQHRLFLNHSVETLKETLVEVGKAIEGFAVDVDETTCTW